MNSSYVKVVGHGYCLSNDFYNLYSTWDKEGHCTKKFRKANSLYFEVFQYNTGQKIYCIYKNMEPKSYSEEKFMASHVVHEYHNGKKWE